MISKEKVFDLIGDIKSVGRHIKPQQLAVLREYYKTIFVTSPEEYGVEKRRDFKDSSCYGCVVKQLEALRSCIGLPPLNKMVDEKIKENRLDICNSCPYKNNDGMFETCGPLGNKLRSEPEKTDSGEVLCGCILSIKAELPERALKIVGGCPDQRWLI